MTAKQAEQDGFWIREGESLIRPEGIDSLLRSKSIEPANCLETPEIS